MDVPGLGSCGASGPECVKGSVPWFVESWAAVLQGPKVLCFKVGGS